SPRSRGTPESVTPSASGLPPCCFPARFLCSVHLSLIRYHSGQILSTPGEHLYICGGKPGGSSWKIGNCVGESLQFALFSPSGMWYTKMIVRGSAVFPQYIGQISISIEVYRDMNVFKKIFGTSSQREVKAIMPLVDKVLALEE